MKRILFSLVIFFVGLLLSSQYVFAGGEVKSNAKPVKAILFYSSHCGACMHVEQKFLPKLFKKYGDKFQLLQKEISDKENFEQLLTINDRGSVPTLKIGDIVLIGRDKIENSLESIIDALLEGKAPRVDNNEAKELSGKKKQ